ncbi:MAG: trigger factor [Bacilli bacterium]|nr:trigger factor [Bacilli bacterium]
MEKKETKKTKEKKQPSNVHEVVVKIDGKEWKDAVNKTFKEQSKDAKVDGFRTGHVPKDVYIKKFGIEHIWFAAADHVLQEAYFKAMTDSKLVPVVQPAVNISAISDEYVEFTFKITTKPEVKVKKYKGLNVKPETVKVAKEEIDHAIEHLLERYEELVTKEDKIKKGDVAIIDFEGFKDDVAFEGGKGENYSLEIGSNSFIPGFEDGLIGLKAGDEKDLKLKFPEDYGAPDLAGAEVVFKVKVNEVKEKVKRKMDKEFFEDLAMEGVNSKETLEKEVKESLKAQKEMDAENRYVEKLLEEVSKNVEVDIPEEMVNEEVDRLMRRFEENMKMQGINLDMYYQFTNSTEADLRATLEKEGYQNVLYRLMLEEVIELEELHVEEKEAKKEAKELAKKYQMEEEEFLKQFGGIEMIKYDLEMRKAVDKLKELNK